MWPIVDLALQALGWVSVVWLVLVDAMIRTGRRPAGNRAFRIAGCAAALSVMAASAAERLWPVVILGGLWLRTEVFGYRHGLERDRAARDEATPGEGPHVPHPHVPHPHVPHPHVSRQAVNLVFRIEMTVLIVIASVVFVIWAQQQRDVVGRDANHTLCHWLDEC